MSRRPTSSAEGFCPPSYQYIVIGPRAPRGGNSSFSRDQDGKVSAFSPDVASSSAAEGGPSSSAANATAELWIPMSPGAPVPKSFQPRQANGQYAPWYGRAGATPSQRSQSSPAGTG